MPRRPSIFPALMLIVVLAGCQEDGPTQPSATASPERTGPSFAATSNSWAPIAPMPGFMGFGAAVGVVTNPAGNSIAYVFGGTDGAGGSGVGTRAYDVATNTWLGLGTSGNSVYAFSTNGVGNIGDKLYFSGGKDYGGGSLEINSLLWVYDPVTNAVTRKADMPLHTADGVTGVIDDKLYVLPGTCSGDGWPFAGYCEHEPIRTLFRYNPSTDMWVTKKAAPHYHKNGAGGVINGKFYVAGGQNGFTPTANLDVYDPAKNSWKTLAALPTVLNGVVGAVMQGQLFVVGQAPNGGIRHYAYNPTSNKWNAKAAPASYGGPATKVLLNGASRLLVLSGATDDYGDASKIYTP